MVLGEEGARNMIGVFIGVAAYNLWLINHAIHKKPTPCREPPVISDSDLWNLARAIFYAAGFGGILLWIAVQALKPY